jgi:pimeloyl-[acyl-carrier protein] methyl ester esterase
VSTALHLEASGNGPPLVFWHGWGMNLRVFDGLRGALGSEYRTLAVDLPGHGRSPWVDEGASRGTAASADAGAEATANAALEQLLATLPVASTLVGWSLGGQFALRAAALAPECVARLILVSSTPRFTTAPDWPHGISLAALAGMQARLASDYRGILSDFLELQVRGSRDAAQVARSLGAALLGHGEAQPAALAAGLAWLAHHDLRAALPAVRQPTLLLAGGYDRVTPAAAGAALAAALPDARYQAIARAAHAPFLSHPQEFLATLRGFLAETAAA